MIETNWTREQNAEVSGLTSQEGLSLGEVQPLANAATETVELTSWNVGLVEVSLRRRSYLSAKSLFFVPEWSPRRIGRDATNVEVDVGVGPFGHRRSGSPGSWHRRRQCWQSKRLRVSFFVSRLFQLCLCVFKLEFDEDLHHRAEFYREKRTKSSAFVALLASFFSKLVTDQ